MAKTALTVTERFSSLWKWGTAGLGIAAAVLFLIYWNMENVVWGGIARLSSFICFAAAVFSALKLVEGKRTITLGIEQDMLKISYEKKGEELHRDIFKLDEIDYVYPVNLAEFNELNTARGNFTPRIRFDNSDRELFMFFFGGRPIVLEDGDIEKVLDFLIDNDVTIQTSEKDPK